MTFIDTADSYGPGVSETLIAEALRPYPAGLVIASKGGFTRPGPGSWAVDCRPEHLRRVCEESLERLRLDRIELYQLHTVDYRVPIEESVGALVDLQREGKIGHIGVSNVSVAELARARAVAEIVSVQNAYNLRDRLSDGLVDICAEAGIAFIPYYPLAKGRLTGGPGSPLDRIAERHQATPRQTPSPGSCTAHPPCCRIPGTSWIAHLRKIWGRPQSVSAQRSSRLSLPASRRLSCQRSSQMSSMRQLLKMLLSIRVRPLTSGCQQVP